MKSQKLENLEKKLNLAENLANELGDLVDEFGLDENEDFTTALSPMTDRELVAADQSGSIMNMAALQQDFMLVRNNILKLVNTGQRILDTVSQLDISDLKASHLDSLASLQNAVGSNLKLMMEIYKDIAAIEKARFRPVASSELPNIKTGEGSTTNIFMGSSADLLKLINDQVQAQKQPVLEIDHK